MQTVRKDKEELQRERVKTLVHVGFCAELYAEQMSHGRWFLHEQPAVAQSWDLTVTKALRKDPRNQIVLGHMCRHGIEVYGELVLKPTKWMTNSNEIAKEVGAQCAGGHKHRR